METNKYYDKFKPILPNGKMLYIETYGCQMNVNDTEVIISIMKENNYTYTKDLSIADVILINTCSIRDNAEQRIWGRLGEFTHRKRENKHTVVGVVGCMAERLKEDLIERRKFVDLVVGPDAYRELPQLIEKIRYGKKGTKAVSVELSRSETYGDIEPIRLDENGISAYVSIMRGCNNFCSYCVVPYTRGVERSRDPKSILSEVKDIFDKGYKEVNILGQNVNSYQWVGDNEDSVDFPKLISMVADVSPTLRVRFSTSHPKDLSDKLIETIASTENICNAIHLPAQSGSSRMLKLMNRKYTREWYLERISKIKSLIPDCSITTDIIVGFCSETEQDHQDTLSLMKEVGFEFAYMYNYSERPGTKAERNMADDVADEVKSRRIREVITLQSQLSHESNKRDVGKRYKVLIDGVSKKADNQMNGHNEQNKVVVFEGMGHEKGEYVYVLIDGCTPATLIGKIVE